MLSWFAERADRIILLFDAHKLDISDEFKQAIQAIRKQEDKIRIVLNKVNMSVNLSILKCAQELLVCYNCTGHNNLMMTLGGHDEPPAADAGVRGPNVEPGQDPAEPRGDQSFEVATETHRHRA